MTKQEKGEAAKAIRSLGWAADYLASWLADEKEPACWENEETYIGAAIQCAEVALMTLKRLREAQG